jgi:hypothetical protein
MRIDNSSSYYGTTKTISLAPEGDEEVVKESVVWDLHAIAFQPELSAQNYFSLIGFFNYLFGKGFGRR